MKNSTIYDADEPGHPVFYSRGGHVEEIDEVMSDIQRKHDSKSKTPSTFTHSRGGHVTEIDEVMNDIWRKHDSKSKPPPSLRNTQTGAVTVSGAPPSMLPEGDKVQLAMDESERMTPGAVHHAPGQEPVRAKIPVRFSYYLALLSRLGIRDISKEPLHDSTMIPMNDGDASMNDRTSNTAHTSLGNTTLQDNSESVMESQAVSFRRNSSRLEDRKRKQKCTRSMMWGAVGFLIAIVCVVVGVTVGVTNRGGKTTHDNDNSTNTEELTSCRMLEYSDLNDRFMEIQSTLVSEFAFLEDAIASPGTSARAAICWMANADDFSSNSIEEDANIFVLGKPNASETLEILNVGVNSETIQRFALALIYYHFEQAETSTESPNNLMSSNWLSPVHICSWDYVRCYDGLATVATLDLKLRKLKGSVPPELALLKTLTSIDLGFNLLSGSVPPELWSMTQLEGISLKKNSLTGTISKEIRKLPQLRLLDLSHNRFTGTLPDFTNLTRLKNLQVALNEFAGTFPSFQGTTSLVILNMAYAGDFMEGTIPTELFLLTKLETLAIVNFVGITGRIPTEIGRLTELRNLYVAELPYITGEIPTELGLLTNLQDLHLDYMQPIPSELGLLTNLGILSFYSEESSGEIPSELCSLPSLTEFQSPWCNGNFCSCPN